MWKPKIKKRKPAPPHLILYPHFYRTRVVQLHVSFTSLSITSIVIYSICPSISFLITFIHIFFSAYPFSDLALLFFTYYLDYLVVIYFSQHTSKLSQYILFHSTTNSLLLIFHQYIPHS